jgi:hypothetical protein
LRALNPRGALPLHRLYRVCGGCVGAEFLTSSPPIAEARATLQKIKHACFPAQCSSPVRRRAGSYTPAASSSLNSCVSLH